MKFGDNEVVEVFGEYAIVHSNEDDELYYFLCDEQKDMIGTCVEKELLHPVTDLSGSIQEMLWDLLEK